MRRFHIRALVVALTGALLLTAAACGGGEPEELTFEVNIQERRVDETDSVLRAKQGDNVTIVVSSDEHLNFHLHGYDIEKEVKSEEPATLQFTVDATGSFPFTVHSVEGSHDEAGEHKEQTEVEKQEGTGEKGEERSVEHQDGADDHEQEESQIGRLEVLPR